MAVGVPGRRGHTTLLEPVQFYQAGSRSLREIVVFELDDGTLAGYLSLPREVVALQR